MNYKKYIFTFVLAVIIQASITAQTHIAVPLGDPVYYVLEQAQMRGLIRNLPRAKPYSRAKILSVIEEIIDNNEWQRFGRLTDIELGILEQFRQDNSPRDAGLDFLRGTYFVEHFWNDVYFSGETGFGISLTTAGGFFPVAGGFNNSEENYLFEGANHPGSGDSFGSFDFAPYLYFKGDLGRNNSYGFTIVGRMMRIPRYTLGMAYAEYNSFDGNTEGKMITVFSEPLTFFPYTYKKGWDGFVWATGQVDNAGQLAWPYGLSIGYSMIPEFSGSALNGHVLYRVARIDREWAAMTPNSSLVLNQSAQPFLAMEVTIIPFEWIMVSSLTGTLEYHNATGAWEYAGGTNSAGITNVAATFQNAYSVVMLELNYKNYFHMNFGSTVIWPRRFELGYIFPFADNFLHQNNIGAFDNMALFSNIQGQYPGLGKIWFSLFLDEANPEPDFFQKDRMMYAYQFGGSLNIPRFPFTSLTLSYTKIEPYNYTHNRIMVPGYRERMEINYVNFGRSLGHYIPPNSDEILIKLSTMPVSGSMFSLQYQMIRHGADYGDRAVDGSSLWSEMGPEDRSTIPALRKFFLRDGAYQWMHILRLRGEYSLTSRNMPIRVFAEIGGVFSYFTDIDENIHPNITGQPHSYRIVNTPQYPHSLQLIGVLGIKLFPK